MNPRRIFSNLVQACIILIIILALVACQSSTSQQSQPTSLPASQQTTVDLLGAPSQYPNDWLLVSTNWLADRLDDPGLRILDVRDSQAYNQAHIPGAVHMPLGDISSTINDIPLEFDRDEVQDSLNQAGLTWSSSARCPTSVWHIRRLRLACAGIML